MNSLDRTATMVVPMVSEYLRILRYNGLDFPRREWSRNSAKHNVYFSIWVDMIMIQDGVKIPGPIMIEIIIDGKLTYKAKIGNSAALMMLDGIKNNTPIEFEICEDSKWLDILEGQFVYLLREAMLSH